MTLADDIQTLRDRVLADLNGAHDYYTDTKIAWGIVREVVEAGNTFAVLNMMTGTVTTHADLAGKARGYVVEQLTEATFQQFLSIFENFFFDFLRLWLVAYPKSLMEKKVDFKDVLDAPDKDAITLVVVDKEIKDVLYDRPAGWFAYLQKRVNLGCPSKNEIDRIAEAKARRDALVHNRGIVGKTYLLKAGLLDRFKVGERLDIPEPYHRETWELIRKVVTDVANAAITKAP